MYGFNLYWKIRNKDFGLIGFGKRKSETLYM